MVAECQDYEVADVKCFQQKVAEPGSKQHMVARLRKPEGNLINKNQWNEFKINLEKVSEAVRSLRMTWGLIRARTRIVRSCRSRAILRPASTAWPSPIFLAAASLITAATFT